MLFEFRCDIMCISDLLISDEEARSVPMGNVVVVPKILKLGYCL